MTATTAKFPAGTYVISDLCYVLSTDTWTELCELMFPPGHNGTGINGLFTLEDGRKLFIGGTKYGDGSYLDTLDNEYSVDSGTIGIMLESEIDLDVAIDFDYSHVHTFEHPFKVEYNDGRFDFGHINIDTAWSHDDDYEDEDEEEWEG